MTGSRRVLRGEHFDRMKDRALLANAGHFDVELDLAELGELATGGIRSVRRSWMSTRWPTGGA